MFNRHRAEIKNVALKLQWGDRWLGGVWVTDHDLNGDYHPEGRLYFCVVADTELGNKPKKEEAPTGRLRDFTSLSLSKLKAVR